MKTSGARLLFSPRKVIVEAHKCATWVNAGRDINANTAITLSQYRSNGSSLTATRDINLDANVNALGGGTFDAGRNLTITGAITVDGSTNGGGDGAGITLEAAGGNTNGTGYLNDTGVIQVGRGGISLITGSYGGVRPNIDVTSSNVIWYGAGDNGTADSYRMAGLTIEGFNNITLDVSVWANTLLLNATNNLTINQQISNAGGGNSLTAGNAIYLNNNINDLGGYSNGSSVSFNGPTIISGNRNITLGSTGETNASASFTGTVNGTTTGNDSLTISLQGSTSASDTATFSSTIGATTPLDNLNIAANSVTLGGKAYGAGTLTIQPYTASTNLHINDGTSGGLYLTSAEQGYIQNDWGSVVFGNTSDTGAMTVGASTWANPVSFVSGNSGSITVSGAQIGTGNGAFSFTGPTTLSNNITTANQAIAFNSPVTLGANSIVNAGSGSLAFGSTVNGSYNLTTTAGSMSLGGSIGGGTALGNVSLDSTGSGALALPAINAATVLVEAGGNVALGGNIAASGSGNAVVLDAAANFNNSGDYTIAPGTGRWIIYSTQGSSDVKGGLSESQDIYGQTYGSEAPGSVPGASNTWVYADYLGSITVTANPESVTYGSNVPLLTYGCSGGGCGSLSGSLAVTNGNNANVNAGTAATHANYLDVGAYAINEGSLADSGYQIAYDGANLTVGAKTLTVSGASANNKVYDTTANATLNTGSASLSGVVSGDTVNLSSPTTGTFAQASVGNGIAVTPTSNFSISGGQSGDYTLTQPGLAANITPATLTINGVAANNKPYDSTTNATLSTIGDSLAGVLGSDSVTLNNAGATGVFASPDAANGIAVAASGFTISGAKSGNYALTQPSGLSANITPATLTITANSINAAYGTIAANTLGYGETGLVGGQTIGSVTLTTNAATSISGNYNVGSWTVTPSGATGGTFNPNNYSISYNSASQIITPAVLTVSGMTASNKNYDATATAAVNNSGDALVGVVQGLNNSGGTSDQVTLGGTGSTVGAFASATPGTWTVTGSGLTISGADSGNYTLTQPTATATISPAATGGGSVYTPPVATPPVRVAPTPAPTPVVTQAPTAPQIPPTVQQVVVNTPAIWNSNTVVNDPNNVGISFVGQPAFAPTGVDFQVPSNNASFHALTQEPAAAETGSPVSSDGATAQPAATSGDVNTNQKKKEEEKKAKAREQIRLRELRNRIPRAGIWGRLRFGKATKSGK